MFFWILNTGKINLKKRTKTYLQYKIKKHKLILSPGHNDGSRTFVFFCNDSMENGSTVRFGCFLPYRADVIRKLIFLLDTEPQL